LSCQRDVPKSRSLQWSTGAVGGRPGFIRLHIERSSATRLAWGT
jgi:hypothetical protein